MKYLTTVNDEQYEIEIKGDGVVLVNGVERHVDFTSMGQIAIYSLIIDHQSYEAAVEVIEGQHHVLIDGNLYEVGVVDERTLRLRQSMSSGMEATGEVVLRSPMPGLIVSVPVVVGQTVSKGQTLVILESMKMENELKAPRDGTVSRLECAAGDSVEQNKVLVTID